jgi:hypothetical protein
MTAGGLERDESEDRGRPEVAYYYPEPFWLLDEVGWVKTLLLFFERVAILLPSYMKGRPQAADPVLAGPMLERGLLELIEPESFVDEELTTQVTEAMVELIVGGAFDQLNKDERFHELSMSRMGAMGDPGLFQMIFEELRGRGLARDTGDGVSIPLHYAVRQAYLLLLAQCARHAGRRHGRDLHPTTNHPGAARGVRALLETEAMPSSGHVVAFDLESVAVDLDPVPLDDVLGFRAEHGRDFQTYARNLRQFTGELSLTDDTAERARLLDDRAAELREEARRLDRRVRDSWESLKTVGGFGLGLVGAGWAIAQQDYVTGTLISLGGGLLSLLPDHQQGSAYSYLFAAGRDFRS